MTTPFIRAKAKDSVDALDNLTAYLPKTDREEVLEFVRSTLGVIETVLARASAGGRDPVDAYKVFVMKFDEYWNSSTDGSTV